MIRAHRPHLRPAANNLRPVLTLLAGVLALASCGDSRPPRADREVGLYTSLPILWAESDDIRDLLAADRPQHWAGPVLSDAGKLVPLDTLADANGVLPLPHDGLLVLAQPRPFSPQENVALDRWVRDGGRVLLFADPMLTMPSRHALGDPRRPQDMAMLSPILAHWGLRMEFDEGQPAGERMAASFVGEFPVNLAGRFRSSGNSGDRLPESGKHGKDGKPGDARDACRIESEGLIARCKIGHGRVFAVSDAALFEESPDVGRQAICRKVLAAMILGAESGD
ncbi:Gldg family protein [Novosphingobium lindaniclasticum]